MSNIVYNNGGKVSIAPSLSADITLTLGDRTYTTSSAADVATTIDNFVNEHGFTLKQLGVLVIDEATAADFFGLNYRDYSLTNDPTADDTVAGTAPFDVVVNTRLIASADNVVEFTTSTGGTNTATITLTYFDADARAEDVTRIVTAQGRGDVLIKTDMASKAVRA